VVTFTGSADTAAKLRTNRNLIANSVPFTAEADSLNCAILAPDVTPDDAEFDLFVKEVAREMTGKAGQKCTAIRRIIVPDHLVDAVGTRLRERLAKVSVGDPSVEGVRMGALASRDQQRDVAERVELLARGNEVLFSARDGFKPVGEGVAKARSSRRPCCCAATACATRRCTMSRRSARSAPSSATTASTRRWRWPRAARVRWCRRW
jgi:oxepin-CoA hydrolase/3-oxo-5,6-dehydrosuberyl-CoA semialdehyde dehydrogenase